MSRATVIIKSNANREKAARWASKMPDGGRIEFVLTKRTLPQNARMHAMLTDVSQQVVWYGRKLKKVDWKDIFTASLRNELVVPGIDPGTFVRLGLHTSDMSKDELSQLMALIEAFGAEHNVTFRDPNEPPQQVTVWIPRDSPA